MSEVQHWNCQVLILGDKDLGTGWEEQLDKMERISEKLGEVETHIFNKRTFNMIKNFDVVIYDGKFGVKLLKFKQ